MSNNKLVQTLREMINGSLPSKHRLSGGLSLQYKLPDAAMPRHRLFVYRVNGSPSQDEFKTMRRDLEAALPGRVITLGKPEEYPGSDGIPRMGRVFSWAAVPKQTGLFDNGRKGGEAQPK